MSRSKLGGRLEELVPQLLSFFPSVSSNTPLFVKKSCVSPTLRIRLAVKRRILDVNVLIRSIKVDVFHSYRLARQSVLNADLREIGRQDEIDILSAHWP